jgi:antitoxin component of RelBE/YafQ-DinJ toxin-antitoxin module
MAKVKHFNVVLTQQLHRSFKVRCAELGLDMSTVVRDLITDFLQSLERLEKVGQKYPLDTPQIQTDCPHL